MYKSCILVIILVWIQDVAGLFWYSRWDGQTCFYTGQKQVHQVIEFHRRTSCRTSGYQTTGRSKDTSCAFPPLPPYMNIILRKCKDVEKAAGLEVILSSDECYFLTFSCSLNQRTINQWKPKASLKESKSLLALPPYIPAVRRTFIHFL